MQNQSLHPAARAFVQQYLSAAPRPAGAPFGFRPGVPHQPQVPQWLRFLRDHLSGNPYGLPPVAPPQRTGMYGTQPAGGSADWRQGPLY